MATEQGITTSFENLGLQMQNLNTSIKTQEVLTVVNSFSGVASEFKEWIKSTEKYGILATLEEKAKIHIALLTSKGPVSDYIQMYAAENEGCTWPELTVRFGEITDGQHAFSILAKQKQNPNESVQVFAERILALVPEAYSGVGGLENAAVHQQLVGGHFY